MSFKRSKKTRIKTPGRLRAVASKPGDFANVDQVASYVEKFVEGRASVIRCKAASYGGAACDHIVMVVFRDFYMPPPEDYYAVWDSNRPMLCDDCAIDLKMLDAGR
jgi:hypothetical protein